MTQLCGHRKLADEGVLILRNIYRKVNSECKNVSFRVMLGFDDGHTTIHNKYIMYNKSTYECASINH